jgi:hypothetical protein
MVFGLRFADRRELSMKSKLKNISHLLSLIMLQLIVSSFYGTAFAQPEISVSVNVTPSPFPSEWQATSAMRVIIKNSQNGPAYSDAYLSLELWNTATNAIVAQTPNAVKRFNIASGRFLQRYAEDLGFTEAFWKADEPLPKGTYSFHALLHDSHGKVIAEARSLAFQILAANVKQKFNPTLVILFGDADYSNYFDALGDPKVAKIDTFLDYHVRGGISRLRWEGMYDDRIKHYQKIIFIEAGDHSGDIEEENRILEKFIRQGSKTLVIITEHGTLGEDTYGD